MEEKMINNIKKIILLILLVILIVYIVIPKSYDKKYKIKEYDIHETFNKKNNRYNISISKDSNIYDFNFDSKYIGKKLIKDIDVKESDKSICIIPKIDKFNTIPLCKRNNENIDYHLIDDIDLSNYFKEETIDNKTTNNITTYNLLDKKYYIWNYNGFTYIDSKGNDTINIFNNDQYDISLATKVKNYLVIPNYDSSYNFKELIIIDINNQKKDTWSINFDISFDSYILGTIDNTIYLVDKKNKVEYSLDVKNKKLKTIGNEAIDGVIYTNNNLEKISMSKLLNNNLLFDYSYDQNFILEDNKLYLQTSNIKILISNKNINKIITKDDNYVYYLVDDTLYYYDVFMGEVKVMQNFEWNFNNDNMIFIY
ncbi:MAG: hypothetical protein IJ572_03875 [Bacilli bacterium]|nr:hypothetical protein [Bacilli bacterium]